MSGTIKIGGVEVPLAAVCIPTSKPRRGSFEALAAVLREGPPPPPDEPDWDPFDIEPLTLSGDSTGVETTATQAPVTLTDEQFKEGCAGPDLAKRMYDMTEKAIPREADRSLRAPAVSGFSATFTLGKAAHDAARAFFTSLLPEPRLSLFTITRTLRDGSTLTEEMELARVQLVVTRRGLPRPGQWSDRARRRRARRLARAAKRRAGISRRGLYRGFPLFPPRPLSAIHAETLAAMREADARVLEAALAPLVPEGATLTIGGRDV